MRYTEARQIIAEAAMALQDILNEDIFDLESAKISRKKVSRANIKALKAGKHTSKAYKTANREYHKQQMRHQQMGSSDTMYHHDPKTGGFSKGETLPKGSAKGAVGDAGRIRGTKVSPEHKAALIGAAKKYGGVVASSQKGKYDRKKIQHADPLHRDAVVTGKPRKTRSGKTSGRVTAPNQMVKREKRHGFYY